MTERFVIEGQPIPMGRPRVYNGRAVIPPRTKAAEQAVALAYRGRKFKGAVGVTICFEMRIPKGTSKAKRAEMEGKMCTARNGDLDNLVKTVLDGLNGKAWEDDSQVVYCEASKIWGAGRTFVTVESEDEA